MEKKMEHEMETGIVAQFKGARLFWVYAFRIFSRGTDALGFHEDAWIAADIP